MPLASRFLGLLALALTLLPPSGLAAPLNAVEVEGRVTAVDDSSFSVDASTFGVTDSTSIQSRTGEPIALADLDLGTRVRVEGRETEAGLVADLVTIVPGRGDDDESDDDRQEFEIEGQLEVVSDSSLTVSGATFVVTDSTRFFGERRAALSFSDLVVGSSVEVEGYERADSALVAVSVKVEEADEDDRKVEAEGPITALGDRSLTVDGVTFIVTDETRIEGDDQDATFEDLAVGVVVEVEGEEQADGLVVATRVRIEFEEDDSDERTDVRGTIEALDETSITVGGVTFGITDGTEIRSGDGPIAIADLAVGDQAKVEGVPDADGLLVATVIIREDADRSNGVVAFTGTLDLVQRNRIALLGRVLDVRRSTEVVDAEGSPLAFDSLAVGDTVTVRARAVANGRRFLALQIRPALSDTVAAIGPLVAVGADSIDVAGTTFGIDAATAFANPAGNAVPVRSLRVGRTVEVRAMTLTDGTRLATDVRLVASVESSGTVSIESPVEVDAPTGSFQLGEVRVVYDEDTLFRNGYDEPISRSALSAGARVKVVGETQQPSPSARTSRPAAGTVEADRIIVYDARAATSTAAPTLPDALTATAYPNPTAGSLQIAIDAEPGAEVEAAVYDVLGREVYRAPAQTLQSGQNLALDLGGLPSGAYVYRVEAQTSAGARFVSGRVTVVR